MKLIFTDMDNNVHEVMVQSYSVVHDDNTTKSEEEVWRTIENILKSRMPMRRAAAVKEHRMFFGSSLKVAIAAVDGFRDKLILEGKM